MRLTFKPENQLSASSGDTANWEANGPSPRFNLKPAAGRYPGGWVLFRTDFQTAEPEGLNPVLHVQTDERHSGAIELKLSPSSGKSQFSTIFLPPSHTITSMSLSPADRPVSFHLSRVSARELSRPELAARMAFPLVSRVARRLLAQPRKTLGKGSGIAEAVFSGGIPAIKRGVRKYFLYSYERWVGLYDTLTEVDRKLIGDRIAKMKRRPTISVIVPVYNVDERYLRAAIESVRRQLYPDWQLCLADDLSPKPHVRRVLEEYASLDSRIQVTFRERNGHIVEASNSALELATGEYVAFLDHDDELTEHALYMVAEELNQHPDAVLLYSDEDKIDTEGARYEPHFKSDWNPDLFLSLNLVTHLAVYRTDLVKSLGGLRKGSEGSQDYDLVLRVTETISPDRIRHIPHVLYHWRAIPGSTALAPEEKNYPHEAARRAIQASLDRRGIAAKSGPGFESFHRVTYGLPSPEPLISLIIPTRDRVDLLAQTVRGMLHETDYPHLEVLIVDNQSREKATLDYFAKIQADPRVRIVPFDAPFNYAAMNNHAVKQARGELIGLINNDIKVISPGWLREMASHALRPEIGAVGAKLYYANDTIQHAGVILGIGGTAGHSHRHYRRMGAGFVGRLQVIQNLSAVTAACLLVRRSVFDEVGGLDEVNLAVAFNDVDFCLRIREKGYRNLFTPHAELYHLESATRGPDTTPDKLPRFLREQNYMKSRWRHLLDQDPYYNPNLTIDSEDFLLAFPPRAQKPWMKKPARD